MRNSRCFLATTVLGLTLVACQQEQKHAVRHPQTPMLEQPPVAQAPPEEQPMAPRPPPEARPSRPGMAQQPGMQHGPQAMRTTHDLMIDALVCALPTGSMAAMVGPRAGGPSMSPGQGEASMEQRCQALAPNVSAQDFANLDELSVRAVRDAIEQRAASERLDDAARMAMLALYDRGIEAEREAKQAMQIADRYSIVGAMPTAQPSAPPARRIHAQIEPNDLNALSARDRLGDLLLFARASGSGPLATEAEGLAWVLATDRFLQVETLAPPLRVYAAEPLFESMLGVPTPQQAQALDASRVTRQVWMQYLETAAKAAEMMPSGQQSMRRQPPSSQGQAQAMPQGRQQAQPPRGGGRPSENMPGGPAMSPQEQQEMSRIVSLISQRMEALSRRMPASDLRMTLDSYAAELRSQPMGVGGGPRQQQQQRPQAPPSQGPSMPPPGGGSQTPSE